MTTVNQPPVPFATQITNNAYVTATNDSTNDVTKRPFFEWNINYLKEWRGILNVLYLAFGIAVISLKTKACAFIPEVAEFGIVCSHPDAYLLVISCFCFLTATLQLLACLTSQRTSLLMFKSVHEFFLYLVSFLMYLTASIAVMTTVIKRNIDYSSYRNHDFYPVKEPGYELTIAAAALGFVNTLLYGASAVLFFAKNKEFSSAVLKR